MLFWTSDTLLSEFHVQHGCTHDDGITSNFMQYGSGYVFWLIRMTVTKKDVTIKVQCLCSVRDLDLHHYLSIIWIDW